MKKTLLLGLGAVALAVGGAVGASVFSSANNVIESEAAYSATTKTIFMALNASNAFWQTEKVDTYGASIVAKYWKGGESDGYSYATPIASPGISDASYVYSFEVPEDIDGFLFCLRKDSSDWTGDCQSVNLSLQTDGKNLYYIYGYVDKGDDYNKRLGNWREYYPALNGQYFLRGDWDNGWTYLAQVKMDFVEDETFSYTGTFNFTDDEKSCIKAVKYIEGAPNYYSVGGSFTIDGAEQVSWDNAWIAANHIKASVTVNGGSYRVVTANNATSGLADAIGFATSFTDGMHETCPYSSDNENYSAVATKWSELSSNYASLGTDAKNLLKASTDQCPEVLAFQSMYRMAYANSGVSDDFAGVPNLSANVVSRFVLENDTNKAWLISALIGVAGIAALGSIYLLSRKRKED